MLRKKVEAKKKQVLQGVDRTGSNEAIMFSHREKRRYNEVYRDLKM